MHFLFALRQLQTKQAAKYFCSSWWLKRADANQPLRTVRAFTVGQALSWQVLRVPNERKLNSNGSLTRYTHLQVSWGCTSIAGWLDKDFCFFGPVLHKRIERQQEKHAGVQRTSTQCPSCTAPGGAEARIHI